jgi:hypothetical protein
MVLALAGSQAAAADLGAVSVVGTTPDGAADLELVIYEQPRIGRNAVVPVGGASVATIEWRRPVELRARTESGMPLTAGHRAEVLEIAQACERGSPRDVAERTERSGTYVVELDCVWLQGFE